MASEIARRVERLEQTRNPQVVFLGFRCQHCGAIAASLDESQVCGHHRQPPQGALVIVVGFGREPTT